MKELHLTAIKRGRPSAPLKWILKNHYIFNQKIVSKQKIRCLDYGCGRGDDVDYLNNSLGITSSGYDPYWSPNLIKNKYDVIFCTYVLNVLDDAPSILKCLSKIKSIANKHTTIFISVRRDEKCFDKQQYVVLPFKVIKENSHFCIYVTNKKILSRLINDSKKPK